MSSKHRLEIIESPCDLAEGVERCSGHFDTQRLDGDVHVTTRRQCPNQACYNYRVPLTAERRRVCLRCLKDLTAGYAI